MDESLEKFIDVRSYDCSHTKLSLLLDFYFVKSKECTLLQVLVPRKVIV